MFFFKRLTTIKIQDKTNMTTMTIDDDDTEENENIRLIHWLYSMCIYYILQITCIITVCME